MKRQIETLRRDLEELKRRRAQTMLSEVGVYLVHTCDPPERLEQRIAAERAAALARAGLTEWPAGVERTEIVVRCLCTDPNHQHRKEN